MAKKILIAREKGRCYCCGGVAHDLAHIRGRSLLSTCFDTHEAGNCHLLCRDCHSEDHKGNLCPSYTDTFIERNGIDAYSAIVKRSNTQPLFPKQFLFDEEMRLREEL